MNDKTKVLLFDLGGVLVRFEGIEPLIRLTKGRFTAEQARKFWLESRWVKAIETGKCTGSEFARGVVEEAGFDVTPEAFIEQFLSWEKGPLPGAIELLEGLRGRIPLACLSNNNELHWGILQSRYGLQNYFDHVFMSHEIGFMKPDRRVFDHAVGRLGLAAPEVVFFDDNPECVQGAEAAGLRAFCARGVDDVKAVLTRLGISWE